MSSTKTGIFRPRRGKRSTAISKAIILRRGEVFFEVPETGVGTGAGKLVMGDGTTEYKDLPYFSESGGGSGGGSVESVNHIKPDLSGNVTISTIPYAENLLSPDNIKQDSSFIFRTSGGTADINSGDAYLDKIKGNCVIENGVITAATPSIFRSIGLNAFDNSSMVLDDYTISSSGAVTASLGDHVCYAHVVGGLTNGYIVYDPNHSITRIGWLGTVPNTSTANIIVTVDEENITSIINDSTSSTITFINDGYICISCTDPSDICVHPIWTGIKNSVSEDYVQHTISIPTTDISGNNLPTATYGFPSVENVRDEINFAQRTYIQRIGQYSYSTTNLAIVDALGTPYIYDETNIFYVLINPIEYILSGSITPLYIVNDFGTEEFIGSTVPVFTTTVYGANLRDKLRRDVLTISPQTLNSSEQSQVRTNIGAASKVASAITDNLVKLSATGDLADSGKKISDLVTKTDGINVLADVSASSPSDSDLFIYNGSTSKWTAQANQFTKPNLLKNGWFTINQRGASSYTSMNNVIDIVDGWDLTDTASSGVTLTIGSDGLTTSGDYGRIRQLSTKPYCESGSTVTISIKLNGTIYSITDTVTATLKNQEIVAGIMCYYAYDKIALTETSIHMTNLRAIKFELGTISTLANDVEPNDTLELLKCQNANISGLSNENFFVNPFFTVNQRGFTSGTISAINGKYTVDMWLGNHGSGAGAGILSKTSNGMHFAPSSGSIRLYQMPTDPTIFDGKTLTFTILCAEGNSTTFEYLSGTLTNFDSSVNSDFYRSGGYIQSLSYNVAYSAFMIFVATECTIKAVKLELGSASTLANDIEPNYMSESLKCQREFYRIEASAATSWLIPCIGVDVGGGTVIARGIFPTPVVMKSTPTITIGGTAVVYDTTYHIVTSAVVKTMSANFVSVDFVTSDTLVAGRMYLLYLGYAGNYIDLAI